MPHGDATRAGPMRRRPRPSASGAARRGDPTALRTRELGERPPVRPRGGGGDPRRSGRRALLFLQLRPQAGDRALAERVAGRNRRAPARGDPARHPPPRRSRPDAGGRRGAGRPSPERVQAPLLRPARLPRRPPPLPRLRAGRGRRARLRAPRRHRAVPRCLYRGRAVPASHGALPPPPSLRRPHGRLRERGVPPADRPVPRALRRHDDGPLPAGRTLRGHPRRVDHRRPPAAPPGPDRLRLGLPADPLRLRRGAAVGLGPSPAAGGPAEDLPRQRARLPRARGLRAPRPAPPPLWYGFRRPWRLPSSVPATSSVWRRHTPPPKSWSSARGRARRSARAPASAGSTPAAGPACSRASSPARWAPPAVSSGSTRAPT